MEFKSWANYVCCYRAYNNNNEHAYSKASLIIRSIENTLIGKSIKNSTKISKKPKTEVDNKHVAHGQMAHYIIIIYINTIHENSYTNLHTYNIVYDVCEYICIHV